MPLDEYLPEFETVERHAITIRASSEQVYRSLQAIDFNKSRIINILFSLRGLQRLKKHSKADRPNSIRLEDFTKSWLCFVNGHTRPRNYIGVDRPVLDHPRRIGPGSSA